ncbi:MAG TPA: alpha/beta fold hydrolase [Gemmatimonadales bacterium]|jgi:pimeloyl-ACP methyl ester carboxylesterase|nr:alpha/beta fold hydrolase [Gemmatimonadales bacterium]
MATATLTKHRLDGALGDILVDVRGGGRESPRPAVVVVHGFKGFKDWGMFPPLAERLARAGFTAVTFNLSGSGVDDVGEFSLPEQFAHNTFTAELTDLGRVVEAVMRGELGVAPPSCLGLLGHSRGGGVAVLHTARDPRIEALVTWSAISTVDRWPASERAEWRDAGVKEVRNARTGQVLPLYPDVLDDIECNHAALDISMAASRVGVPWLIVHGASDESVPLEEGERLAAAAPGGSSRLLRIEHAGHTFGAAHPWKGSTPELERAVEASVAAFSAELG